MPEETSTLMQLCTENVYNDNIFHLLGIPTTATQRQIRRRKEDVESAHEMGDAAWKREFGHLMGTRSVPTFAEVNDAFGHLSDPEYRIVSEFFWLWPMDEGDAALRDLLGGNRSAAIRTWEQVAPGQGRKSLVAQHNLAVLYHFYAIDAERQVLDGDGSAPADFHKAMCDYWEEAFGHWAGLVGDDDFWGAFEERMRAFDDPRLTGGFVRRFRRQFPVAVDSMNARLAAEYVRRGKPREALRHIGYMRKSIGGPDDAQEALRLLFEPIESRVGQLIGLYTDKASNDPSKGFRCANELLDEADEDLRLAEFFRQNGTGEVEAAMARLLSRIATACNGLQVNYGNKTERWEDCLAILRRIQPLACTQQIKDAITRNIEVVESNISVAQLTTRCWFCGEDHATDTREVSLYGEVVKESWSNTVHWKKTSVSIPTCERCRRHERELSAAVAKSVWGVGMAVNVYFLVYNWDSSNVVVAFLMGIFAVLLSWLLVNKVAEEIVLGHARKIRSFPTVVRLLAEGYSIGEKPPNVN